MYLPNVKYVYSRIVGSKPGLKQITKTIRWAYKYLQVD